jgi:hypothetical protein
VDGLPRLLLGGLLVLLLLLGHDPTGSSLLRFRRPRLRRHFLLAPRKDGGSGGRRLGGGMGDLIYGRACYDGGSACADSGGGGDIHLHGCVWAGVARLSSEREKMRQTAFVGWDRGGQERRGGGRAGCPNRRISGPNLRPKWVRAHAIRLCYLFG